MPCNNALLGSPCFDAKKELKRVSRGEHLPETHPDKPKGVLEAMAARVAASVATELVTLPGYEVSMTNLAGAAIVATVTVPAKTEFYWVGAFDKWYYVTSSIDGMQVVYESKAKGIGERTSPKQNDE
jgi:hypothetical protein